MAEKKKKKHWISGAIKHPGIEQKRAAEHGISTHEQLERDAHSDNPTLRGRGNLGLRFEGFHGGISGHKKSREDRMKGRYGHG